MYIGLEIMSKKGKVIINEIIEDGAAFNDGFLQVKYNFYNNVSNICY